MCLPAAVVGAISAVTSVVGSIASYTQQQAQTTYANAVAQQQYAAQQAAYAQSERAYKSQIQLNEAAANRAYVSEQQKLQAEYQKAAQDAQKLSVESLQAQGNILASGRSGRSIGLLVSDVERSYGRDLATLGQNLAYSQQDYFTSIESSFIQAQSANNAAASNRMLAPSAPLAVPGPSPLGLVTGLGEAAIGATSAYNALKPPGAEQNQKDKKDK
jgi:hypothetical protein